MSLLKHEFFPRSLFETHFGPKSKHLGPSPSSLDIFDPFDELVFFINLKKYYQINI